jgi:hypothetical protein
MPVLPPLRRQRSRPDWRRLLETAGAANVLVAVSRQVDGPMLGGRRFNHFLNCARELLEQCGYDQRSQREDGRGRGRGDGARARGTGQARAGATPAGSGGQMERRVYAPTRKQREYSASHREH